MYRVVTFESDLCDSKADCLKQLADKLNMIIGDDADSTVCDVEKDWVEDKHVADYRPSLKLKAVVLIREMPDMTGDL